MRTGAAPAGVVGPSRLKSAGRSLFNGIAGLSVLLALWWLGGYLIYINPDTTNFAGFGPVQTFKVFPRLIADGTIQRAVSSSGYRLGVALLIAISAGIPIGILLGRSKTFRELSNAPFQLLRMISPLSWEPIAVIVFLTWNQAIIFLLAIASVWPVAFATAAGLAKVDPAWFKVARNLGAKRMRILFEIIVPQILPTIVIGLILSFVIMMSVLSVPLMINAQTPTMLTVDMAFRINAYGDYGVANALGFISYLMTGVVAWIYLRQGVRQGGAP